MYNVYSMRTCIYLRVRFTHFWTNFHIIQTVPCILFVLTAIDTNFSLALLQQIAMARSHPYVHEYKYNSCMYMMQVERIMLWSQERRTSFKARYTIDNVELNSPLSDVMYNKCYITYISFFYFEIHTIEQNSKRKQFPRCTTHR